MYKIMITSLGIIVLITSDAFCFLTYRVIIYNKFMKKYISSIIKNKNV